MAKPLELITEVSGRDAMKFLKDLERPMSKKNEAFIKRAKKLKYRIE
jgi:hypothetical protein